MTATYGGLAGMRLVHGFGTLSLNNSLPATITSTSALHGTGLVRILLIILSWEWKRIIHPVVILLAGLFMHLPDTCLQGLVLVIQVLILLITLMVFITNQFKK